MQITGNKMDLIVAANLCAALGAAFTRQHLSEIDDRKNSAACNSEPRQICAS